MWHPLRALQSQILIISVISIWNWLRYFCFSLNWTNRWWHLNFWKPTKTANLTCFNSMCISINNGFQICNSKFFSTLYLLHLLIFSHHNEAFPKAKVQGQRLICQQDEKKKQSFLKYIAWLLGDAKAAARHGGSHRRRNHWKSTAFLVMAVRLWRRCWPLLTSATP